MMLTQPKTGVHLPTGSRCDADRHALALCVDCGLAAPYAVFTAAECCGCRECPCCAAKRAAAGATAPIREGDA